MQINSLDPFRYSIKSVELLVAILNSESFPTEPDAKVRFEKLRNEWNAVYNAMAVSGQDNVFLYVKGRDVY